MPKPVDKLLTIVSPTRAYIPQLQRMGPISQPISVPFSVVRAMIYAGVEVYEYDMATRKTTEITIYNLNDVRKEPVTPPAPVNPVKVPGIPVPEFDVSKYEFEYNEDGTVNETNIDWEPLNSKQRKALRKRITAINDAVQHTEPEVSEVVEEEETPVVEEPTPTETVDETPVPEVEVPAEPPVVDEQPETAPEAEE